MAGAFKDRLFETIEELSTKRTKTSSPTITSSLANVSIPDTASEQTIEESADQSADQSAATTADETVEQAVEETELIGDENNNDNEKFLDEV